jgi:hypothetical protein
MYTSGTGLSTYDMPLGLLLLYSMIILSASSSQMLYNCLSVILEGACLLA